MNTARTIECPQCGKKAEYQYYEESEPREDNYSNDDFENWEIVYAYRSIKCHKCGFDEYIDIHDDR